MRGLTSLVACGLLVVGAIAVNAGHQQTLESPDVARSSPPAPDGVPPRYVGPVVPEEPVLETMRALEHRARFDMLCIVPAARMAGPVPALTRWSLPR
jgi:hypothetical protein